MSTAPAFTVIGIFVAALLLPYVNVQEVSPIMQMLGSGLAAALLSQTLIWWKESRREKQTADRDRRFFALKLAIVLERYAIECAMRVGFVHEHVSHYDIHEPLSDPLPGIPPLELPDSSEWRWIDSALSSQVLSLAPRLKYCDGSVEASFHYGDFHQGCGELIKQLRAIGFETLTLASTIRTKYGLDPQSYLMGKWDFAKALKPRQDSE